MLAQKPGNWELLYREASALQALEKHEEAGQRFKAILALKLADDGVGRDRQAPDRAGQEKAADASAMLKRLRGRRRLANRFDEYSVPPLTRRAQQAICCACGE